MAFLNSIEKLRSVEWGKTFLWDVRFVSPDRPPSPFSDWFPALDIEVGEASVESHSIAAYNTEIKFPKRTAGARDIKLTFNDDINHTLFDWFRNWMDRNILNDRTNVSCLSDIIRTLEVVKLDNQRRPVSEKSYMVYPEGDLNFIGNGDSAIPSYSVVLVIAGKLGQDSVKSFASRYVRPVSGRDIASSSGVVTV